MALLYEWAEYAELEILSDVALDAHLADLRCMLANIHRDRRKHKQPFPLREFLFLKEQKAAKRQTPEQMKQVLKTMSAMHNKILDSRRAKKRS